MLVTTIPKELESKRSERFKFVAETLKEQASNLLRLAQEKEEQINMKAALEQT